MPAKRRSLSKANFTLIRIFAAIGIGISGYLLVLKLTGEINSLVGCGTDSGCANVLGSKWSQFFHVPVTAASFTIYTLIFILTFSPSRSLLITAAMILVGAALWFMGLMTFVIDSFCPWCLATHITGVLTAFSIFHTTRRTQKISWGYCSFLSFASLAILAAGQIWGPEPKTFAIEDNTAKALNVPVHKRGEGRKVLFGKKEFDLSSVPFLGPADAKHVLVKYFDYTCGSCRNMEEDLEKLMHKYPKDFAVILLPTPLNRKCNRHVHQNVNDHPWACELAKLGLAAWKVQPESFPEVHQVLFSRPILNKNEAEKKVYEIVAKDKLNEALKDPWIQEMLNANAADYRVLAARTPVMPKMLLVDTKVMQGVSRSSEIFVKEMEKLFGY